MSKTDTKKIKDYKESYSDKEKNAIKPDNYLEVYDQYFPPLFNKKITILELGIFGGQSLTYFANLFPKATIIGLDINPCPVSFDTKRIKTYQGSQDDPALMERIIKENNIDKFDIIIDDCSHIGTLTCDSFHLFFPHLAKGGLYVVEDWGTGYWNSYPDGREFNPSDHLIYQKQDVDSKQESDAKQDTGSWLQSFFKKPLKQMINHSKNKPVFKSHQFGIPGFLKQLSDEVAMGDITSRNGLDTHKRAQIEYVHFYAGIAVMKKSGD